TAIILLSKLVLIDLEVDTSSFEDSTTTKRSFQNASPHLNTMDSIQTTSTETPQAVSIPTILALVNVINHSDQCLHADTKLAEYISQIPDIHFSSQEEKNNYSTELFSIQEEVRSKYNTLKHEELRLENAKYKDLVNSWGLPDATQPQKFQLQSRRKNSTPVKNIINKRQKTTETTECTNKFSDLNIEEPPEQIEIDDDEDVTPPPPKKPYAPPITIDNVKNSAELLKKLQQITGIKLTAKLIGTSIRIYPQTPAAYHLIRRHATQENLQHFTFQLPEDKKIRVVIRGMPTDMPPEDIMQELEELGFTPESCHILTHRKTTQPMPLFLVSLPKSDSNRDIFNISELCSLKIEVESLRKKVGPPQCYRCQGFFHNSNYCTRNPKCLKCGNPHLTRDCQKDINSPPTCGLCQGAHTANFLLCPMNPLNRPKKEEKKKSATEHRQKIQSILKEKRENRTSRPVNHTTPTTYAEAAKSSPVAPNQAASTSPPPTSSSSVTDIFNQLKDPECLEMFGILKKYIEISKSGKSISERFTQIMALLKIDQLNV
ncbi:RNA-directed DNA polymerase from mobile element jockey, partial [Nephila pilipes]